MAGVVVLALVNLGLASRASASDYPMRTIVVICPWAAGGGTDRVARFLADQLQRELGSPVVVQNRTGGKGAIGHVAGAFAEPDGYTITMGTFELSTMRAMGISELTYRDFQPLMQVNADPAAIIVRSDAPWHSLRELLDDAARRPGKLKMSGTSTGGAWDLARAGLLLKAGLPVDAILWVPSQGAAPSLVDLLGGHIDAVCCSVPEVLSQLQAGQVRVLCVMAADRVPEYPDIPTAKDENLDWEAVGWRGLFLPKETPPEIQDLLLARLQTIVRSSAYQEFMSSNVFGSVIRTGAGFEAFLEAEENHWKPVVEATGYKGTADPGPWFFPSVLTVCLVAGVLLLSSKAALSQLRLEPPLAGATQAQSWVRFWHSRGQLDFLLLLAGLAVYLAALPWLGFFVSTQLFATLMMVRLGVRLDAAVALAAGMLAVVYLLFVRQFQVVLPASPWWAF